MQKKDIAEDFRFTSMLLAVKTGAAVFPSEDIRDKVMSQATHVTFDELLSRLFAEAVTLGIWRLNAPFKAP